MKSGTILTLVLAAALPALAGRPLVTDDASILQAASCQLEMWIDRSRVATDLWTVPACNFGANIEWQFGGSRTFEAGRGTYSQANIQAKTVFRSVDDHPWGVGLVAGVYRSPHRETHTGWDDPYVIVPLSFKFGASDNLVHLNIDHCPR